MRERSESLLARATGRAAEALRTAIGATKRLVGIVDESVVIALAGGGARVLAYTGIKGRCHIPPASTARYGRLTSRILFHARHRGRVGICRTRSGIAQPRVGQACGGGTPSRGASVAIAWHNSLSPRCLSPRAAHLRRYADQGTIRYQTSTGFDREPADVARLPPETQSGKREVRRLQKVLRRCSG